jgi:foldase protein PrsA
LEEEQVWRTKKLIGAQKMRYLLKIFLQLLTTALIYEFASGKPTVENFPAEHSDKVAIGAHQIFINNFSQRYLDYLNATGTKDNPFTRQAILNNMINEILLEQYDDNSKILKDKNYQKEIAWVKNQTTLAYLKDQEVYAKIIVSDQELREAFERANEKLSARHLFAATEEEANNLYELLKIGVSFDLLAKQVFTDSTLRNNGGDLGYFSWGDMDPAFEDATYALNIGETSRPVRTANGYSIIRLEDRVKHPLLTETEFLQKKSHLERVIRIRKKNISEKNFLTKIYTHKSIKFNYENLNDLLNNILQNPVQNVESGFSGVKSKIENTTCATYNGKPYSQADIFKRVAALPAYHKVKIDTIEKLKATIEGFIIQDKLLLMAKSYGYDKLPIVNDAFKKQCELVLLQYKRDEITDRAELPDSAIYNYYKENLKIFSTEDELNMQEIIVADKILADSLMLLISNGHDFGELAKQYSIRSWSAKNNGIMGFAPVSKFGMLKDNFWNANTGQLIGPLAIGNYYGIFKLLEKKQGKPNEFVAVKNQVTQSLKLEQKTNILKDYLKKLRRKVHIEVNENVLYTYKLEE